MKKLICVLFVLLLFISGVPAETSVTTTPTTDLVLSEVSWWYKFINLFGFSIIKDASNQYLRGETVEFGISLKSTEYVEYNKGVVKWWIGISGQTGFIKQGEYYTGRELSPGENVNYIAKWTIPSTAQLSQSYYVCAQLQDTSKGYVGVSSVECSLGFYVKDVSASTTLYCQDKIGQFNCNSNKLNQLSGDCVNVLIDDCASKNQKCVLSSLTSGHCEPYYTCTDSESTDNPDVKGTVTLICGGKTQTFTDQCSPTGTLRESACKYINGDTCFIGFVDVNCGTGYKCSDGKCVSVQATTTLAPTTTTTRITTTTQFVPGTTTSFISTTLSFDSSTIQSTTTSSTQQISTTSTVTSTTIVPFVCTSDEFCQNLLNDQYVCIDDKCQKEPGWWKKFVNWLKSLFIIEG